MTVVAAIPAHNAEVHIKNIIKRTKLYVDQIVLVDDGSSDATAFIAKNMGAQVIRHGDNLGKAAALETAFEEVKKLNPSVLVTIYANGFHNPDDIPAILKPVLSEDSDIVNGAYVTSSGIGLDTTFEDVEAEDEVHDIELPSAGAVLHPRNDPATHRLPVRWLHHYCKIDGMGSVCELSPSGCLHADRFPVPALCHVLRHAGV